MSLALLILAIFGVLARDAASDSQELPQVGPPNAAEDDSGNDPPIAPPTDSTTTSSPKRDASSTLWISQSGPIGEELLQVQAIIVKDENVTGCSPPKGSDVRYSDRRYLMCSGSILTDRYILTSASCVHETLHVRHNVRAPVAAMIAPFTNATQVIKVVEWIIHPQHVVDPHHDNYALHNLAIAKLVCKISKFNFHPIELPDHHFLDLCAGESCGVTVIKKLGPVTNIMFETKAKNLEYTRRKRESNDENESSKGHSKFIRSIMRNLKSKHASKNGVKESNMPTKRISIRSSDGTQGCPAVGSAVMPEKVQSALVATSCDDRQPETAWVYTDLFDNLDWLNQMIGKPPAPGGPCSTCIYNIFIGCDEKSRNCYKDILNGSGMGNLNMQNIQNTQSHSSNCSPKQPGHNGNQQDHRDNRGHGQGNGQGKTALRMLGETNGTTSKNADQDYFKLISTMYRNRNESYSGVNGRVDVTGQFKGGESENHRASPAKFVVSDQALAMNEELTSRLVENTSAEKYPTALRIDDGNRDANADYGYGNDYKPVDRKNSPSRAGKGSNALRPSDLATLQEFFQNDQYEESGIPHAYLVLYDIFLEEQRQMSRNKNN